LPLSDGSGSRGGGVLYLVPALLGPSPVERVLPPEVVALARSVDGWVAENAKSARQFLRSIGHPRPLAEVPIAELNEHTPLSQITALLQPVREGQHIGLLSEAGCPAIADPGAALVARAHAERLRVVPLTGPSSLLLALMASGLNGQRFCFQGYLPVERTALARAIRRIESESWRDDCAQLFIETPYRNRRLLAALLSTCQPDTRLCLASSLTLPEEAVSTRTIAEWHEVVPDLQKSPTVFILQATAKQPA
jgi:16S rRNA (cytidine1402-2'-O)-methyltransferase